MSSRLSTQIEALAATFARSVVEVIRAASLDDIATVSRSEGESPSPAKRGPGRPKGSRNGTGNANGKRGIALLHAMGTIQKEFHEGSRRFGVKIYQDKATKKWVVRLTDGGKEITNKGAEDVLAYDDSVKAYEKYKSLTRKRLKSLIIVS